MKLGFQVSQRTASHYPAKVQRNVDTGNRWVPFLKNHRDVIAVMDFFTMSNVTFRVVYCFFVIGYDRRRVLHFNTTEHPTDEWAVQQLREALPGYSARKYMILDRDSKCGQEASAMIKALASKLIGLTAYRSPWPPAKAW